MTVMQEVITKQCSILPPLYSAAENTEGHEIQRTGNKCYSLSRTQIIYCRTKSSHNYAAASAFLLLLYWEINYSFLNFSQQIWFHNLLDSRTTNALLTFCRQNSYQLIRALLRMSEQNQGVFRHWVQPHLLQMSRCQRASQSITCGPRNNHLSTSLFGVSKRGGQMMRSSK